MNILLVFAGAGIGGVFRFFLGTVSMEIFKRIWLGTLFVNVLGSILSIVLWKFGKDLSLLWQQGIRAGLLGGLTTFSGMSFEIFVLWSNRNYWESGLVLFLNIFFGI